MDKETLSNYGWIVILVLILAVMLALATPFGQFIADGFKATYTGLFQTGDNAMDTALGVVGVDTESKPVITFDQEVSLTLSSPISTDKNLYTLSGTVTDESGIKSLRVNGVDIAVDANGKWTDNLTLAVGEVNEIPIIATNNKDKITEKTIYLTVKLGPGLYQTGSNYTVLLKSWDTLISEGIITTDGKIVSGKENHLNGDLIISEELTILVDNSYKNCTALTGVIIPDTITDIGWYAFYNCEKIASIHIPSNVTSIGPNAFTECIQLSAINFGTDSKLSTIGKYAFSSCSACGPCDADQTKPVTASD